MSAALAGITALNGLALYAGHHVGDYWVQTDHQALTKGKQGEEGVRSCIYHVATYTLTQAVFVACAALATGYHGNLWAFLGALAISALTHYTADRREFGLMFRVARLLPGKANFLKLGIPREHTIYAIRPGGTEKVGLDNPSLGTGAWALDQSWHIFWGVFVAALVMSIGAA
jgi:hypothetical protein